MRLVLLALSIIFAGCNKSPAPASPAAVSNSSRPTVDQFECQRCHLGMTQVTPVALDQSCTGCHLGIKNGAFDEFWPESTITTWKKDIRHLVMIPSLQNVETRFRRDWFIEFVQNPHDLRPRLEESMPRLNISLSDAEALADELGLKNDKTAAEQGADIERGRALFNDRKCLSCHDFGAMTAKSGELVSGDVPKLAPNLSFARQRFRRDALVAWLDDPGAMKRDTLMPDLLTQAEAVDVAAFLVNTPLIATPKMPEPVFLPILKRDVDFEEVNDKVFSKICIHCHGDGENTFADGDGGPGNTGGFGFPAKNIDFSTEDTALGAIPRIVSNLKARHFEVRGLVDPNVRGMPLGLPPLSPTDIQLIETWVSQNAIGN